ncbi:MAG: carboxypeptidase-like regulatory domain-containing protein [Bacteroidales bacterium]|nr:carboxypeptidase-like regulatory domain-containing protein [Bacteroidales bacterium]
MLRLMLMLTLIGVASFFSHAQEHLVIQGEVKDQVTGMPIEGVNIRLQNTVTGTSTNAEGVFNLMTNRLPAILIITHVAYSGEQIMVTQLKAGSFMILLNPKTVILDEAEITAGNYQVFNKINQEVIDYDFLDTNLVVLSYDFNRNRYRLVFSDENFDTISITDVSYLKKPQQLFNDCMGNCHLLTNDSVYQLYSSNQVICLTYPVHIKKFRELLGNCLFETDTHLVFEGNTDETTKLEYAAKDLYDLPTQRSKNEQWKHLFYLVNKKTHEKVMLDEVDEWEKNRDAFEQALFRFDPHNPHAMFFGEILRSEEMMFFKPSFQTVKLSNDTIYYFNHLKSQIDVYSVDLHLLRSIKIEYHQRENWMPVILTDNLKSKFYTIFKTGANYSLNEINLFDGSVKEVAKIKKVFPQKIKVNNDKLYFLYNDVNNVWGRKQLFKGELQQ